MNTIRNKVESAPVMGRQVDIIVLDHERTRSPLVLTAIIYVLQKTPVIYGLGEDSQVYPSKAHVHDKIPLPGKQSAVLDFKTVWPWGEECRQKTVEKRDLIDRIQHPRLNYRTERGHSYPERRGKVSV